jgi:UDP-glucose 4-epimerase
MIRDYIYVDDAIGYATSFLGRTTQHRVYNIGSGVGVSVNEVLNTVSELVGEEIPRITIDTPPGFVHQSVTNIDRLTAECGRRDTISLSEGVWRALTWIRRGLHSS